MNDEAFKNDDSPKIAEKIIRTLQSRVWSQIIILKTYY